MSGSQIPPEHGGNYRRVLASQASLLRLCIRHTNMFNIARQAPRLTHSVLKFCKLGCIQAAEVSAQARFIYCRKLKSKDLGLSSQRLSSGQDNRNGGSRLYLRCNCGDDNHWHVRVKQLC